MKQYISIKTLVDKNRYPLTLFLVSRIALVICLYISLAIIPLREGEGLWRSASENLFLDGLARGDSGWYISIAKHGYLNIGTQRDTAFFPAYPLLISLAKVLGDHWLIRWAIFVSNSLFLCGLCITFQFTKDLLNEERARQTAALLAFAPLSFFFSSVYTESLFFTSSVASFWLAKNGRLYPAMATAAIASVTKVVGFICIPFAYLYFRSSAIEFANTRNSAGKKPGQLVFLNHLLALAFGFSPILIHLFYLRVRFGNYLEFAKSQEGWSTISSPMALQNAWRPIIGLQFNSLLAGEIEVMAIINSATTMLVAILVIIGLANRALPKQLLLWALVTIGASMTIWSSGFRYVSAIFPVYILLALAFKRLPAEIVIACSAMAMSLFAVIFSHWHWVA